MEVSRFHCARLAGPGLVILSALGLFVGTLQAAEPSREDAAFFEKQVRPLLARSCFQCHGAKKQESGLRVDSRATLMQGGESGAAVVPGQPEKSLLIDAVLHQNDLKMPPKGKLKDEEVAVLVEWVKRGVPWPNDTAIVKTRGGGPSEEERKFWSFQPLQQPAVPKVQNTAWPKTPIDNFILARHEAQGLTPVRSADKRTLIRRATFDLTGLPPTPSEVQAFVADQSPDAFAILVERLLASPAYGERWGRHWFDVVRYADTAGETADIPVRESYKYRNWVIQAFNQDKPYDEFIREQIAGDILAASGPPEKFADRVTATGFIAISRRFGFDSENYHHLTIQDTIDTLGQSVLGLTIGCARCHDHKFDPISTEDYYALYGIFESTKYTFPGSEQKKLPYDLVPLVPAPAAAERKAAFDQKLAALGEEIKRLDGEKAAVAGQIASAVDLDGAFELQEADAVLVKPWQSLEGTRMAAAAQSPYSNVYAAGTRGVNFPSGAANNAIVQTLAPNRTPATHDLVHFNIDFRSVDQNGQGSYRFYLGHGPGASAAVELFATGESFFLRNGEAIETVRPLKPGQWYNVQLAINLDAKTYSGTIATPGEATEFSGKAFFTKWDGNLDTFFVDNYGHLGGPKPAHQVDNLAISDKPLAPLPAPGVATPIERAPMANREELKLLRTKLAEVERIRAEQAQRLAALTEQGPYEVAYAAFEGTGKDAQVQKRGEPTKPGDVVPRRFLEVLGGDRVPEKAGGSGRLELATWLTRPENPLTARVMVNRIWQHHFGGGLVSTENDFGTRGIRPTHPELLDYLAGRFMSEGWSVKAMHRLVMLSSTYQLSGDSNEVDSQLDAGNQLLWRFNRRRLDAEEIRDALLAVGDNLDRTPGGPHPFPAVKDSGFTQHMPFSAIYETNRRSVYLMTPRLKRHPYLALFDGADPNASTPKRVPTMVPTQALFMMNDPMVHAQAEAFARQLAAGAADDNDRIKLGYEMALAREPRAEELQKGLSFLERYKQQLTAAGIPADQQPSASLAAFARTLVASNEFLFVD